MKLTALILYLLATTYITMLQDERLTDGVNRILLTGYYLVNLGYVSIMLTMPEPVSDVAQLISSVSTSVGRIVLTLAIMHYCNISIAIVWNKMNNNKHNIR